jgi:PAS domain S-box-containing protein
MSSKQPSLDREEAIRTRAQAIWEREGRPHGRDLDHWHRAEQQIAAEQRLRLAVEPSPNAMVIINREGEIVIVNAQAEQVFGYSRGELVGQPVEMLVPQRFRGNHPDLRGAFFADPSPRPMGAGRDLSAVKKDGSEFPVEIGLNPIETDEGPMVLAAVVDITQRKAAESALRESEHRACSLAAIVESSDDAIVSTTLAS